MGSCSSVTGRPLFLVARCICSASCQWLSEEEAGALCSQGFGVFVWECSSPSSVAWRCTACGHGGGQPIACWLLGWVVGVVSCGFASGADGLCVALALALAASGQQVQPFSAVEGLLVCSSRSIAPLRCGVCNTLARPHAGCSSCCCVVACSSMQHRVCSEPGVVFRPDYHQQCVSGTGCFSGKGESEQQALVKAVSAEFSFCDVVLRRVMLCNNSYCQSAACFLCYVAAPGHAEYAWWPVCSKQLD